MPESTRGRSSSGLRAACMAASNGVQHQKQRKHVAVIGAGAAGLASAKELLREGHKVVVFESDSDVGGVWLYRDDVESDDLLGLNAQRGMVHGSMYRSLRTNLPRELMAFTDFPFDVATLGERSSDSRRFCSHTEVQAYLQAYADAYGLRDVIRFNTRVVSVSRVHAPSQHDSDDIVHFDSNGDHSAVSSNGVHAANAVQPSSQLQDSQWAVEFARCETAGDIDDASTSTSQCEVFDAVVVCNGHYSVPNLPQQVRGMHAFRGVQMHSHNYRTNEAFRGATVVVVGAAASGEDICRDVAAVARRVYLCARSWQNPAWAHEREPIGERSNIWRRVMLAELRADDCAVLEDGEVIEGVTHVIYCTGYKYSYPFLSDEAAAELQGGSTASYVAPLWRHTFVPSLAPSLSFVGLPLKIVPFPQFELQARWIAQVLSGRCALPSTADMLRDASQQLQHASNNAKSLHVLGNAQWEFNDWLADQTKSPRLPAWRREMHDAASDTKRTRPETYRDHWTDFAALAAALDDIKRLHSVEQQSEEAADDAIGANVKQLQHTSC